MHFYQRIKKHTFTMSKYSVLFGTIILSLLKQIVNKNVIYLGEHRIWIYKPNEKPRTINVRGLLRCNVPA